MVMVGVASGSLQPTGSLQADSQTAKVGQLEPGNSVTIKQVFRQNLPTERELSLQVYLQCRSKDDDLSGRLQPRFSIYMDWQLGQHLNTYLHHTSTNTHTMAFTQPAEAGQEAFVNCWRGTW